ncbi:glycosyltransferase [Marinobacterium rhizophilum]|uniref:glycosyltransferase n=1 Tax=Marinobacterium rhizophilum TaxID=420402 RepID=UPI0003A09156|nr:glycosyltransferase [Marinobacterium rhizophilum]
MNITHVTTVHPRYDSRIFFKQCISLSKFSGCNVDLIVADGKGNELKSGVNIYDLGKPKCGRLGRFFLGYIRLWSFLKKRKCNVLHFHDPELIFFFYIYSFFHENIIFDMHENVPKQIYQKTWIYAFFRKVVSFFYRVFERVFLKRFSIVFAESSYEADYSWLTINARSVVVQNMPILELIPRSNNSSSIIVGYIGGVTKERGILRIVESINMLRERGYNISFLCIGPVCESINKSYSFQKSLSDGWVKSLGRLEGPEGWKLISNCKVGFAVLEETPNYIESWPTKLFEYMTMGIPVVVSNFPLYKELVERVGCGIVVDPKNTIDIVDAVKWLIENPDEAFNMGARGREAVEREYNWSIEEIKLIRFYVNIAGNEIACA